METNFHDFAALVFGHWRVELGRGVCELADLDDVRIGAEFVFGGVHTHRLRLLLLFLFVFDRFIDRVQFEYKIERRRDRAKGDTEPPLLNGESVVAVDRER
jgi:hypothetical protein